MNDQLDLDSAASFLLAVSACFLNPPEEARAVLVDGPFEVEEEGAAEWTVSFADDDGEEIRLAGTANTRAAARSWGRDLAGQFRLELLDESIDA
jgi:hypothetical protein